MITPLSARPFPPVDTKQAEDLQLALTPQDMFARLLGDENDAMSPLSFVIEQPAQPSNDDPLDGREPDTVIAAPMAQIFNQNGFFGHAIWAGGTEIDNVTARSAVAPSNHVPTTSADDASSPITVRGLIASGSHARVVELPSPEAIRSDQPLIVERQRPVALTPLNKMELIAVEAPTEEVPSHPDRRQARLPSGGGAPVRVAVSEIEQGLRVIVQVSRMFEPDREQMRDAIEALLARHGLRASDVQIYAMTNSRTKE
ncbi:hypothetical protein [Sphingomonas elodea]|uniref:hypothetical protein n=1 Tax=Sphingomonas elodea TaxID=179878 RepID=UPI00111053C7|nr:hypothetical protein [Sphingomonas elodea]